jgi:hypothetical protein
VIEPSTDFNAAGMPLATSPGAGVGDIPAWITGVTRHRLGRGREPQHQPHGAPGESAGPASKLRQTDLGPEKLCTRCDEWWPADPEFFYSDPEGVAGLFYCCKACYQEWKQANAIKKANARRAAPHTR